MNFVLKKTAEITEADVITHPVWVTFYEPEEFELLEELGLELETVEAALASVGYSDEYAFPLPARAASLPFKYLYLSVQAKTPEGTELLGLRTHVSLSLFHKNKVYFFNKGLLSLSKEQATNLAAAIGENSIFPLNLFITALAKNEQLSLTNAG
nr:hypothetical protein [uncultured Pseudomonas sp.]